MIIDMGQNSRRYIPGDGIRVKRRKIFEEEKQFLRLRKKQRRKRRTIFVEGKYIFMRRGKRKSKGRKIFGEGKCTPGEEKKNGEGKRGKYLIQLAQPCVTR